jgi:hypothetical protein
MYTKKIILLAIVSCIALISTTRVRKGIATQKGAVSSGFVSSAPLIRNVRSNWDMIGNGLWNGGWNGGWNGIGAGNGWFNRPIVARPVISPPIISSGFNDISDKGGKQVQDFGGIGNGNWGGDWNGIGSSIDAGKQVQK